MMMVIFSFVLVLTVAVVLFMQQKSFGRLPSEAHLKRMEQSPNYRDGSFQNILPTSKLAEGATYGRMMYEFFSRGSTVDAHTIPSVKTDLKFLSSVDPVIVWFGHSSYFIHIDGKNILVDPMLTERASPLAFMGPQGYAGTIGIYTADDFPEIDLLIITHDHYDHLGYNTITALKAKTKMYCTPLGVGAHLRYWGVGSNKIKEFDWWEGAHVLSGIELIAAPARHFSGRGFKGNKTLWASFILKTDRHRIFIGGDSGYDATFKIIGDKYGPFDVVMLEAGQYNKQWPYIHMFPEQTVQACIDLKGKVLMPVHWGKFTLALHKWSDPIERVEKNATERGVLITTPIIGQPVVVGKSYPVKNWWKQ